MGHPNWLVAPPFAPPTLPLCCGLGLFPVTSSPFPEGNGRTNTVLLNKCLGIALAPPPPSSPFPTPDQCEHMPHLWFSPKPGEHQQCHGNAPFSSQTQCSVHSVVSVASLLFNTNYHKDHSRSLQALKALAFIILPVSPFRFYALDAATHSIYVNSVRAGMWALCESYQYADFGTMMFPNVFQSSCIGLRERWAVWGQSQRSRSGRVNSYGHPDNGICIANHNWNKQS